jgi:hypothetical protein
MLKIYKLITYSGIAAFISLSLGAYYGLTGLNFKIHKGLGITTLALACIHAGLVLYKNIKIKLSAGKK